MEMTPAEMKQMHSGMKKDSSNTLEENGTNMEMDEVELTLRRFASTRNDSGLNKLINSIFTETAEQKAKHESDPKDPAEDKKEGE
jgi:hypothetical protein